MDKELKEALESITDALEGLGKGLAEIADTIKNGFERLTSQFLEIERHRGKSNR